MSPKLATTQRNSQVFLNLGQSVYREDVDGKLREDEKMLFFFARSPKPSKLKRQIIKFGILQKLHHISKS